MPPQTDDVTVAPPARVVFMVNGTKYTVKQGIPPNFRLVDFIRDECGLSGTKVLCREAGCGVCNVLAKIPGKPHPVTVQACQVLVYSCAGWQVETIESLGNKEDGYHPLQDKLHAFYGTQCGFCSPGMIMTMFGQMQKGEDKLTTQEVEESLDGNICRCTGYRPILDAFKSFAEDAPQELNDKVKDIEDMPSCSRTGRRCTGGATGGCHEDDGLCHSGIPDQVTAGASTWFNPRTLQGLYNIVKKMLPQTRYQLVAGNTAQGVFKDEEPMDVYINTSRVKDLHRVIAQPSVIFGASVTLAEALDGMQMAQKRPGYNHLAALIKHWKVVANTAVRNVGSLAGNLMMKHQRKGFPSDIFLTLLAADAAVTIGYPDDGSMRTFGMEEFLNLDMFGLVILSINLPALTKDTQLRTYKITPRAVNAHAYVNAAMVFRVDAPNNFKVKTRPKILFGGINPNFVHASLAEAELEGMSLDDEAAVQRAAEVLQEELKPDQQPQDADPAFRKNLAVALLYKTIIGILGSKVPPSLRLAGEDLQRDLSSGKQVWTTDSSDYPIAQAIPKLESKLQISGEAEYLNDIPSLTTELHGAFVTSSVAVAKVKLVDPSEALRLKGVVAYIDKRDIPGKNSFVTGGKSPDKIFVEEWTDYAGQAIGLIVADRHATARKAAKLVKVEYTDHKKPILTIDEALKSSDRWFSPSEAKPLTKGDVEAGMQKAPLSVSGEQYLGTQYHMMMEPYAARCVPTEDGMDVWATTQWINESQGVVSQVLNIPHNAINLSVRRLGGAFGGKITRGNLALAAAAVAANKLRRPVRVNLDLTDSMTVVGWREPYYAKYKIGFEPNGKLLSVKATIVADGGQVSNDASAYFASMLVPNTYSGIPDWELKPVVVVTDTASNTWCRTPAHIEAVSIMENLIEHVAHATGQNPLDVRKLNLTAEGDVQPFFNTTAENNLGIELIDQLEGSCEWDKRYQEVANFNEEHTWRKRGMSLMPMLYPFNYFARYNCFVTIYQNDGTVAVSHGGIEMGQGINTKVAQVAASSLGVPLDKVVVKSTSSFTNSNSSVTGGSMGSDLNPHGIKVCCDRLRERIDKVKKTLKPDTPWEDLIATCAKLNIDLTEHYHTLASEQPEGYMIWGAAAAEVEIDCLTGQTIVRRVDILEDVGRSMSPYVDIGQIEGAYIMGLGLQLTEKVKFDSVTGMKLSNGTWEYKPPTARDIPVDFRITMLPKASNPYGVVKSKATGEPALCLSYGIVCALRHAIRARRDEIGLKQWFELDTPVTVDSVQQLCAVQPSQFRLR